MNTPDSGPLSACFYCWKSVRDGSFSFVGNNRLSVISSAVICEGSRLHWLLPWAWELAAALRRRLRPGGLVPPRERSAKARDNKWIIQSFVYLEMKQKKQKSSRARVDRAVNRRKKGTVWAAGSQH
jgi:hypothetical protein